MDYSPVEGLIHKYEMGLLYVTSTCSAHCRFCYREELIGRKEVERQDGTVAKKGVAKIEVGRRSLLWIWTHGMIEWLRLWLWSKVF